MPERASDSMHPFDSTRRATTEQPKPDLVTRVVASTRHLRCRRRTALPCVASLQAYGGGGGTLYPSKGWPHHGRRPSRPSGRGTEAAPTKGLALTREGHHLATVCKSGVVGRRNPGSVHAPNTPDSIQRPKCCLLRDFSACKQRSMPHRTRWHLTLRSRRPAPAGRVWPLQGL